MLNRKAPNSKKKLRVVACIQARIGSTRLKKKALLKISGRTLIENIFRRLKYAQEIDDIILATSKKQENDVLIEHAQEIGLKYFRGSEEDLISRFYETAKEFKADALVRITGDCPLVDPELVDKLVKKYREDYKRFDFFTNVFPPTFPDGLDIDIIPFSTLRQLNIKVKNPLDREYLTFYIMKNPKKFKIYNLKSLVDLTSLRWTVDYPEDLLLVRKIFKALDLDPKNKIFNTQNILNFLKRNPQFLKMNINRIDKGIFHNIRGGRYHLMVNKLKKYEQ